MSRDHKTFPVEAARQLSRPAPPMVKSLPSWNVGVAAWARTGDRFLEPGCVRVHPQFLAGAGVVADDGLVGVTLLLCEEPIANHGERRPARADAMPPQFLRRVLGPIGGDADACEPAVARRAAEFRPVAGAHARNAGASLGVGAGVALGCLARSARK